MVGQTCDGLGDSDGKFGRRVGADWIDISKIEQWRELGDNAGSEGLNSKYVAASVRWVTGLHVTTNLFAKDRLLNATNAPPKHMRTSPSNLKVAPAVGELVVMAPSTYDSTSSWHAPRGSHSRNHFDRFWLKSHEWL